VLEELKFQFWRRLSLKGSDLLAHQRQLEALLNFQRAQGKEWNHFTTELWQSYAQEPCYTQKGLGYLRKWLVFLESHGYQTWLEFLPKAQRKSQRKRPVPSHARVLQLFELVPATDQGLMLRAMLEMAYGSALRASELIEVELQDLDLRQGILTLRKTKNRCQRKVPLTHWALHHLKRYLKEVRPKRVGESAGSRLWLMPCGGRVIRQWPTSALRRLLASEQLPSFDLHSLRHACATRLLENGVDLRLVQALLGHIDLEATKIYTEVSVIQLRHVHQRCHPRNQAPF